MPRDARPRSGFLRRLRVAWQKFLGKIGLGAILCDTCMYDYGTACTKKDRPNATVCGDYRKRR